VTTPARPPPIRTDASNAFAHFSMRVRVPKILEDVVRQNDDYAPAVKRSIEALAEAIRTNAQLPPLSFPSPDEAEWAGEIERAGWLASTWFVAECYVYRCLMACVRYWETSRDPFAPAKRDELAGDGLWRGLAAALDVEPSDPRDRVNALLGGALWGNRVDLSYAVGSAFGAHGAAEDLLADDRSWAADALLAPGADVHVVTDNTGSELSMDLALADTLMTVAGARVSLHVKMHPMFVSDATERDVWDLVGAMRAKGGAAAELASRLVRAFDGERLRVLPDFFWNGPRFLDERPERLSRELDAATIVVLKGDANYRRAVGDAIWPDGSTFAEATAYFPAPLLCLRTMKSDGLVGIPASRIAELDRADPEWRINGRRGVIQGRAERLQLPKS
jgi:hypothetical protein